MNPIKNNLYSARHRARLSREEAALRVRVTPERIARWETGEEVPCTEILFELSALYRIPPHKLLIDDGGKRQKSDRRRDAVSPALDAFRQELTAMREVELLPLDDETIDYCVRALQARLSSQKSQNK